MQTERSSLRQPSERESPRAPQLRVLFGVQQDGISPGTRYRVLQYLPHFRSAGLDCTVVTMQGAASTRRSLRNANAGNSARVAHALQQVAESWIVSARLLACAGKFDRLYLYKIPLPSMATAALRRHRARIIFDLDDAWDSPEGGRSGLARFRSRLLRHSFERAVALAALVVVSNDRNAAVVSHLGGRSTVVPTTVDVDDYPFRDRATAASTAPVLGWIGTPSTAGYLPLVESAILRAASERQFVVRLVGSGGNPFAMVRPEVRDWSRTTEAQDVGGFDIGLMPMPDTEWTRGKAALKALQYGASGAPTIASWTPTNETILGRDQGAVLCRTEDDWRRAILDLLEHPARRAEIGRRGRKLVEDRFSLRRHAPRLVSIIARVEPPEPTS